MLQLNNEYRHFAVAMVGARSYEKRPLLGEKKRKNGNKRVRRRWMQKVHPHSGSVVNSQINLIIWR
jgi:hypothetical protein